MRFDLEKLVLPMSDRDRSRVSLDATSSGARSLAIDLVDSRDGRRLAEDLVLGQMAGALAADLVESGGGRDVALGLLKTGTFWHLASDLVVGGAGQGLIEDLAGAAAGRLLARDLVEGFTGGDLAMALFESDLGLDLALAAGAGEMDWRLARDLVEGDVGWAIETSLGQGPGRAFVNDLVGSAAGREFVLKLAHDKGGRVLASAFANSSAAIEVALYLVERQAVRPLAMSLLVSDGGRALARETANGEVGRVISQQLVGSGFGRSLLVDLAGQMARPGHALVPLDSEVVQGLEWVLEPDPVAREFVTGLAEDDTDGYHLLAVVGGLVGAASGAAAAAALVALVTGSAAVVLFTAAALTLTEQDADGFPAEGEHEQALVDVLVGPAQWETKTALEEPLGLLQRIIDDDRIPLNPEVEDYHRRQLDTIGDQLGGSRPDRFIVERAIRLIVEELAQLGHVGEGARELLDELGAQPPELVDAVVDGLRALVDSLAGWGAPDSAEPAGPVREAGERAEQLGRDLDGALAPSGASRSRRLSQAVARLGSGALIGVGKQSGELLFRQLNIDEFLIRLAEAIERFWKFWVV